MNAKALLFQHNVRGFLKAQAVALAQMVGKQTGKRAVAHHHPHLAQQRVLDGYRVPKGNGGGGIGLAGWYDAASHYIAQRIDEHQPFTTLDQLARIKPDGVACGSRRVLDTLRVDYDAGRRCFLGALSRQATTKQAFISSNRPLACHLLKYQ